MKRIIAVTLMGLLCLSIFSMLPTSLVMVSASSPPGMVDDFCGYCSTTYELLLWGNPLINGFPDTSVTAFNIYKDGGLLATVDWHTCRYRDYNPVDRWCQYGVSAVNAAGEGPQKTFSEWWSSMSRNYYDLTLYCNPPQAGAISGFMNFRSGQTTAGWVGGPAMVVAHPAPGYNFIGPWTKTGAITISFYGSQPICYIDNWWGTATITGYFQQLPAYDVTISAHCNTEGTDVSVPITMDGAPTGYNTPHVFSSLTGSHTFAVPSTDPSSHPFTQWNTGETTRTITVAGGGTYTAYYQAPPPPTYDVAINAHCNTEGVDVNVGITKDGSSTGFNTPHTFTALTGTHTFGVPSSDASGHPFKQWSTSQTTMTITVSSGGTYTAYYEVPPLTYDVTIAAYCYKEGVDSHVPITKDGVPSGYNTPYTFNGLTGSHTFTVPDTDPNNHPFEQWNTGQTATTITVISGGTYTAYYYQPYDVIIVAYCYTEKVNVNVQVIMDDYPVTYQTPCAFRGLTSSHSFKVADKDANGHLFWKWNTDQTSTTITVTTGGTYVAYYRARYDIALCKAELEKNWVCAGNNIAIRIGVQNEGTLSARFLVSIKADSNVKDFAVFDLPSDGYEQRVVYLNTKGWSIGTHSITATAIPVEGELPVDQSDNGPLGGSVNVQGLGYAIIVAGKNVFEWGSQEKWITDSCNQAYNILRKVGFSKDRIYYLAPFNDLDVDGDGSKDEVKAISSKSNLESAIKTWAGARVGPNEPLFMFLCDHGDPNIFWLNFLDGVSSTTLASWLDTLEGSKQVPIHVIYQACNSGSFIDENGELSKNGRVIICSSKANEFTHGNFFSVPFWNCIELGYSVLQAFNYASDFVKQHFGDQTPILDDNGDCQGHTSSLPNGGDGAYASNLHIGSCEWPFPWVSCGCAESCYIWPPPPSITLWAKIENKTPLCYVRAWMKPPDWVPRNGDEYPFANMECFEMTDENHDGNFTVNIPSINFTNHASGPSEFKFIMIAEEENGMFATPFVAYVEFTETGQPTADNTPPRIDIMSPLDLDVVHSILDINGTVSDDVCLEKCELYVDSNLCQTINLPKASNSFFEFTFDTTTLSNGNHTIMAQTFDTSNNSANQALTILVINNIHDVTTASVIPTRTWIGEGFSLNACVTIVNQGSYAENLSVTFYVNDTIIATKTATNLPVDGLVTLNFAWDTTGFAKGNYTIKAIATTVPGETDTLDNTLVDGEVMIIKLGDINLDEVVNYKDASLFRQTYIGAYYYLADFNQDGVTNYKDASLFRKYYIAG